MKIDFAKGNGLVPAIIQDELTGKVLMLGYMNEEALQKTQQEGRVTFFGRTKQRLWTKGETSGNFLELRSILIDCDNDTLLIKVHPTGPVCHTGQETCFDEKNQSGTDFLAKLQKIIRERKYAPLSSSYTSELFESGKLRIAKKVGEEAVELALETEAGSDERFLDEAADLLYHYLVLLESRDKSLSDVVAVLRARHS